MRLPWRVQLSIDPLLFAVTRAIARYGGERDILFGPVPHWLRDRTYRVHRQIQIRLRNPNRNWLATECYTTVLAGREYPLRALADVSFKFIPNPDSELGWIFAQHINPTGKPPLIIKVNLPQGFKIS